MSSPDPVSTNPTTFTIAEAAGQQVTGFQIQFGQVSGGPYTLIAPVPAADVAGGATGATGSIAGLNEQLAPGTWYAVANAIGPGGTSVNSSEVEIVITPPVIPVPAAPTFSVA
jgi:hypothetical protein